VLVRVSAASVGGSLPAFDPLPIPVGANAARQRKLSFRFVLRFQAMLENAIPRLLGWVPISLRRALIGHPDNPSRLGTFAHNLLNRITLGESHVFGWQGTLEGYRMSMDWGRYRSFVYGIWVLTLEWKVLGRYENTLNENLAMAIMRTTAS
jgi:hypothetical protein